MRCPRTYEQLSPLRAPAVNTATAVKTLLTGLTGCWLATTEQQPVRSDHERQHTMCTCSHHTGPTRPTPCSTPCCVRCTTDHAAVAAWRLAWRRAGWRDRLVGARAAPGSNKSRFAAAQSFDGAWLSCGCIAAERVPETPCSAGFTTCKTDQCKQLICPWPTLPFWSETILSCLALY